MKEDLLNTKKVKDKKINIGLFTHKNCDYDAVASTLTMANYLMDKCKEKIEVIPIMEPHQLDLKMNSKVSNYRIEDCQDLKLDYAIVLDVNETDRVYGMELLKEVPVKNRFLIDHHIGNRQELEIFEENKIVLPTASSTSEIIASRVLPQHEITEELAYNLYIGMASDTAGFTRQVTKETTVTIEKLPLQSNLKEYIINKLLTLTPEQQKLYDAIEEEKSIEGLKIYHLKKEEDFIKDIGILKNYQIEQKIKPSQDDLMSCLIIECGNSIFLKFRKEPTSNIDIVKFAEHCNGGGHITRCAGKFLNTNYEEVLNYIKKLFIELKNNSYKKRREEAQLDEHIIEQIQMVFASNNKGKLKEMKSIFGEKEITSLKEENIDIDVVEDQESFYDNALKKAKEIFEVAQKAVIADDSGLCISELENWPGVMTHRFLGENKTDEEINMAILQKCESLANREASVVCNLVYYDGKNTIAGEGILKGVIVKEPRGTNGFGFDPIFELENGRTLAELTSEEKNQYSARALAAKQLKKKLTRF